MRKLTILPTINFVWFVYFTTCSPIGNNNDVVEGQDFFFQRNSNNNSVVLRWIAKDNETYYNLSVRENGKTEYTNLFVRQKIYTYNFRLPTTCFDGEFLLESETTIRKVRVKPKTPEKINIGNFDLVYNWYDEITEEITVDIKWKYDQMNGWRSEDVKQRATVHVLECGNDGINADVPPLIFTSTTTGQIILPKIYSRTITGDRPRCLILVSIESPIKICQTSVPIQERIDQTSAASNSYVINIDCENTVNLPCGKFNAAVGPPLSGVFSNPSTINSSMQPKCDPTNVTARWLTKTKLQIEWNFNRTNALIRKYALRYGQVKQKTSADATNNAFPDMFSSFDELGRIQTSDNETKIVVDFHNEQIKLTSLANYRISICALYDGNVETDVNWTILPNYHLNIIASPPQRRRRAKR